jgi:hypothetical protein
LPPTAEEDKRFSRRTETRVTVRRQRSAAAAGGTDGMSVHVEFIGGQPGAGSEATADFLDSELSGDGGGGTYCYHVGAGGELILLVDEHGESRVERVYSPAAWRCARGDVWRKGLLLQG